MQLAMIGLGRMGMNMARRLLREGHQVVAYNRTADRTNRLVQEGATGAYSLDEVARALTAPRIIWMMLPAGPVVDEHIQGLLGVLSSGDIVIEGGNTHFKDDLSRAERLESAGMAYLDAGVSGGIWGLDLGYCLMIGGSREAYEYVEPILKSLAPPDGYLYCGGAGAGHFVKMIHNGIEYGMMQAYAEGFALLEASPYGKSMEFAQVARLWNQGSVIRSWLLELLEAAFGRDGRLSDIRGYVEDSGEGRWTVQQAVEAGVSAPVIATSLFQRFRSRVEDTFADRVLAALRREFGGHAVLAAKEE